MFPTQPVMPLRKNILLAAVAGISVAGGALYLWLGRSDVGEKVTHPDLVVLPEPAVPAATRLPSLADLRLRILHVRVGRSVEGSAWTNIGARVEGSTGPLPVPPPVTFGAGVVSRLVLGSGATRPHVGLMLDGLTGEFEVHCGPAAGESVLRELVVEIPVRPGAEWDTTRFTLEEGASVEKDFGPYRMSFGPSPIDPDRQVDWTITQTSPSNYDALVEARDRERPLLGTGGHTSEAGTVVHCCFWADSRRDRSIEFPVELAIHRPRAVEGTVRLEEQLLRFVIRDVPLE